MMGLALWPNSPAALEVFRLVKKERSNESRQTE